MPRLRLTIRVALGATYLFIQGFASLIISLACLVVLILRTRYLSFRVNRF